MLNKPDFRRSVRSLVTVGQEQIRILDNLDIIQGIGGADTHKAWMAAREAARAATRMANEFKYIACTLEALYELEK